MPKINDHYAKKREIYKSLGKDVEEVEDYDPDKDDGSFWMCYKDFRHIFHNLYRCIDFPDVWTGRSIVDYFQKS